MRRAYGTRFGLYLVSLGDRDWWASSDGSGSRPRQRLCLRDSTPPLRQATWQLLLDGAQMRLRWMLRVVLLGMAATGSANDALTGCDTGLFQLRAGFEGAGLARCAVIEQDAVQLEVLPEDGGRINPSPWYGFHVRALTAHAGNLQVHLRYGEHKHRYHPKVSVDGRAWQRLADADVELRDGGAALRLRPSQQGVYVSAQENLNGEYYRAWRASIAKRTGAQWREVGRSVGGRPIWALHTNAGAANYILLLGRQHPPEVSGAMAFMRFAEAAAGNRTRGLSKRENASGRRKGSSGCGAVPFLPHARLRNGAAVEPRRCSRRALAAQPEANRPQPRLGAVRAAGDSCRARRGGRP